MDHHFDSYIIIIKHCGRLTLVNFHFHVLVWPNYFHHSIKGPQNGSVHYTLQSSDHTANIVCALCSFSYVFKKFVVSLVTKKFVTKHSQP